MKKIDKSLKEEKKSGKKRKLWKKLTWKQDKEVINEQMKKSKSR